MPKDKEKRGNRNKKKSSRRVQYAFAKHAVIDTNEGVNYEVVKQLGKGAFASVYEAIRSTDQKHFALKVEFFCREKEHRIPQELQVYLKIDERLKKGDDLAEAETAHFLHFVLYLQNDIGEFLFIEKGGVSIESIMKRARPSLTTSLQWAIQTLEALEHLHLLGYIHRDIKQANFLVSDNKKTLKIIDFGMAVKYAVNEEKMPKTSVYDFIGTVRYAPRASHLGMPQSRRDDLESWLYLSMEYFNLKSLPWNKSRSSTDILHKKIGFIEKSRYRSLFEYLPLAYPVIVDAIRETDVMDVPNYNFYYDVLTFTASQENLDLNQPFEIIPHKKRRHKNKETKQKRDTRNSNRKMLSNRTPPFKPII